MKIDVIDAVLVDIRDLPPLTKFETDTGRIGLKVSPDPGVCGGAKDAAIDMTNGYVYYGWGMVKPLDNNQEPVKQYQLILSKEELWFLYEALNQRGVWGGQSKEMEKQIAQVLNTTRQANES